MCSALVGASLLALEPAAAQSLSDSEKIERLQRQTEQLQKQLKALQEEIAQTKKKAEKVEAAQAKEVAPDGNAAPTPDRDPTKAPTAKAPAWTDKVKITLGGFVTADSVFRARNQVNDIGTNFTQIPYPFSPLYGEHEFHGRARQSRLSLLVEGNNTAGGFHLLGGQSWSLVTQNTVGITPRKENIPLTIDADYVDGFNYTRNWQIRLVQDFGQKVWLGVSVETPATVDNNVPGGAALVNGVEINAVNTAESGCLQTVAVTTDHVPEVIDKVAFNPGWGQYEVFGIERFFTDNTLSCFPGPCVAGPPPMLGTTATKTTF